MSVLDELSKLENGVRARMTELRPLLDEYAELEKAAKRLGIATTDTTPPLPRRAGSSRRATKPRRAAAPKSADKPAAKPVTGPSTADASSTSQTTSASPATTTKTAPRKSRRSTARSSSKSKREGGDVRTSQRAEQLAALVQQRPGLSVKDAGNEFGVDAASLYRVVKKLETDGKLVKRGRELHPV